MNKNLLDKYLPTIGIESHVQLKTRTKLFARVNNDARKAEPNTTVSPVCFGLPGVLPVLNEHAVELAIKAGIALNSKIAEFSKFDRKHYFYPDLPKGYQITQFDQPILGEGFVMINDYGKKLKIGVERAHLEEDAGKLVHPKGVDYSLVDLNRAGTPLLEIVSKPEIHSALQAKAYVRELYLLMKYAEVSDVDLFHGHMRFDVNISVNKKGQSALGTRSEVKNLNSFRAVEKAVQYEIQRQIELLEKGQVVLQETRGWDEAKQKTTALRSKEEAHDYRYFPEPDLPPVVITKQQIDKIAESINQLPDNIRQQLLDLGINARDIETVIEAQDSLELSIINTAKIDKEAGRFFTHWLANNYLASSTVTLLPDPKQVVIVYRMFKQDKVLSSNNAYLLMGKLNPGDNPEEVAKSSGLIQLNDVNELDKIIAKIIANNNKAVADVKKGEEKAVGFLVGQVMKATKGQANPQMVQQQIKQMIGE